MEIQQIKKKGYDIQQIGGKNNQIQGLGTRTIINTDHNSLKNRDLPKQHPISAIEGLEENLRRLNQSGEILEENLEKLENNLANAGKINDVIVNGESVVNENKEAVIDLTADKIKTFDENKTVADAILKKVSIGSFMPPLVPTALVPSFILTKERKVKMTYVRGGAANFSNVIYKAFEVSPMFMYYIMNMTTGAREDFAFPALSAFDIYDGKYIIKQSSEVVDISNVGEYEEYPLDGLGTTMICVRTTFENLGITDYVNSDGSESNAWLSFISGCCNYVSLEDLAKQTANGIATKDNYVYILLPKSLYDNQTGTATEKVRATLTMNSMNKLIYKTQAIETIEHGETVLNLEDNTSVNFMTFPNMLQADFVYIAEQFKQITKTNTTTGTQQIFQVDDVGNINMSVSEFQKTTLSTLPAYPFTSAQEAQGVSNYLKYALSKDNVLYVSGYIRFTHLKATHNDVFAIALLPSAVASLIKTPISGYYGIRENLVTENNYTYHKLDPTPKLIEFGGTGTIFFATDEDYEEITKDTFFRIAFALKIA